VMLEMAVIVVVVMMKGDSNNTRRLRGSEGAFNLLVPGLGRWSS
jgi:hypothetical protein